MKPLSPSPFPPLFRHFLLFLSLGLVVPHLSGQSQPPNPPTWLAATGNTGSIGLAWTGATGATSYNISRSLTNGSGYAPVATGVTSTVYTDTGLASGTTYYYVVAAVNASGTSGYSNQASATTNTIKGTWNRGTGFFSGIALGSLVDSSVVNQAWPQVVDYSFPLSTWMMDVYVPPTYDGSKPFGLVVYITSDPVTGIVLQTASADKNLIWISPQYVGNYANSSDRYGAGLMAAYRAKELFNIDPRRVYTSGKSGGARTASSLAFYHSEVFHGTAPSSGIGLPRLNEVYPDYIYNNSYASGKTSDSYYQYSDATFGWLSYSDQNSIDTTAQANKLRSYVLTRFGDYRQDYVVEAYHCGYEPQGDNCFLYDGSGTHQDATDAEMELAIDYLDRNDTFPVNANILSGSNGFSRMVDISQAGASASGTTTGSGNNAVTSFTLTPSLNSFAAIKSGSSFYWDNGNGSTVRWLWEVANAAPTNQKTCFGLWFNNENWGGGAPVSVTSGTNPGILVTITQNGTQNRLVVSARPDSGGETVLYDGYFSFVPAYATAYTSTQFDYLPSTVGGSPVELRMDLNKSRWQLTFNGIRLNGSNNKIATGVQIGDDNRLVFGYWDLALGATFWKHDPYTNWDNTWSPFTKSVFTAATGALSPTGAAPSPMNLSYVIASDPNLSTPLPPCPVNLYASGYNGSVKLSWNASSGATSYNIKRSSTLYGGYSLIATTSALNYIDTAVSNGSTYYYVVTAQTANGESATGPVVRATPDSNSLIAQLRFDESSGSFASDSTGHGWGASLINGAGWSAGKINNALSLSMSGTQYATLPSGVLNAVTDCTISTWIKPNTLSTWMRVFDFGTGTGNYMFLAPKGGTSKVHFGILIPPSTSEQVIESSNSISVGTWTHLAVTISGSTGILYVNGLASGTNNAMTVNPSSLGVTTQNYIGKSQWSSDPYFDGLIDHFQIYSRALSSSEVNALATPLAAPVGLAASGSIASVTVNWNPVSGASGYNVMRSLTSGSGYSMVGSALTGTSFTDIGLANGTTYYYTVTSLNNGVSESSTSAEVSATTYSAPVVTSNLIASGTNGSAFSYQIVGTSSPTSFGATGLPSGLSLNTSSGLITGTPTVTGSYNVPLTASNAVGTGSANLVIYVLSNQFAAPAGLTAEGGNTSVTLNWFPVPGAASYKVKRSTTSGGTYTTVASGVTATTYTDTPVTNWTTYYYVVSAVDGSGQESANSLQVSATPMYPTTWIGTGADSNWQTGGNWSTQPGSGDTLYFAGSTRLSSTNNYPANTAFGGIVFNSGAGAFVLGGNSLTLQGDLVNNSTSTQTLNLGLALAGANRTINTASGNVSISGAISESGGSFGLIKTGNSTLSLSGVNTFSGGVSLNAGALSVNNSSSLGSGTLTLSGGTLNNTGATSVPTLANPVTITGTSNIQVTTSQNIQLNGAWTGSGLVNVGGGGVVMSLYLNGTNAMTSGTIAFANASNAVRIPNANFGNAALSWVFNNTTANRETLDFASGTISFGSISGGGIIQGDSAGVKTMSVGALGYNDTFTGIIQDISGTIALLKTGTGRLTLSGVNSYSAGTTINGGVLNITGTLSGAGAVAINSGGTLAGTGKISGATTVANGGAISPGNGGVGVSGALTFSGTAAALTLTGGSVLNLDLSGTTNSDQIVLSGSVSASGTTTVNLQALASFAGPGTYPVISGSGTLNAANFAIGTSIPGYNCALNATNGNLSVVVTNAIPAAPTGLTAVAANSSVSLVWNAVPGASSYNVKRSTTNGSGYVTLTSVTGTSYIDATVSNGTTYYYIVTGVSPAGEGSNSNQVSATPASSPVITSAASASGTSGSVFTYQITATNSPTSFGASGLPAGLNVNTSTGLITGTPSAPGTTNVTLNAVNANGTGTATLALTILVAPPTITSASSVTGTSGSAFSYQITATNSPTSFGASGLPTGLSVNTSTGLISGTPSTAGNASVALSAINGTGTGNANLNLSVLPAIPSAPTGVIASGSNASVILRWTASSGATSYNVKRSTTSGSGYVTVTSPSSATCIDTGLVNGTTYYYVVSAVNSTGESANSSEVRATADSNSMIAFLRFDESSGTTAADATGHGWNGTLVNAPGWSSGMINNAVSFNGSSQYVTLPSSVVKGVTDFTVSAWVKLNAANNTRIFDFGTGTAGYMELCPKNSSTGYLRYETLVSGTVQQINTSYVFPTGVWTHVAVTLSGSTGTLYVNGASVGTNTGLTLNPAKLGATNLNYIGKSQWSNDPYLNGLVDEFQIYSRALSPSEVAALAAPTSAPTGVLATGSNTSVILSWNPVNGATGYNVLRSLTSGSNYSNIASSVSGTSYTDTGLTNGTRYYYLVTALNGLAESATSSQVSAVPDGTPPVVSVPSNITVMASGSNGAVVTFSTSANDAVSGPCATTNTPPSGSVFPIGTTTVTASATDASGNVGTASFTVTVQTLPISSNEQQNSTSVSFTGNAGTLIFASPVPGHTYQLQYCDDLATGGWQNYGSPLIGDSANLQFNLPVAVGQPRRFYRVKITK